jgi:putative phosphoribosyl transferase
MRPSVERAFGVPASGVSLDARLVQPERQKGVVVLFASSVAESPGTLGRLASEEFAAHGLATLRLEPVTLEERSMHVTAHIMADRLIAATFWIVREQALYGLPVGLFGVERTAKAVLIAAAAVSDVVRSVVAAGDRPLLRRDVLIRIEAPTLLIAAANDPRAVEQHRATLELLHVEKKLKVVEGVETLASDLGIARAIRLATRWFDRHLGIDSRLLEHPSRVRPHR